MVGPTTKTVTDAVRRMAPTTPDEHRVVKGVMTGNGVMKHSGSNWVHFGSKLLAQAEVIQYHDNQILIGPCFEDYLIEQGLTEIHNDYLLLVRSGAFTPAQTIEESDAAFDLDSFREAMERVPAAVAKIGLLQKAVEEMMATIAQLAEALDDSFERDFGENDGGSEEESVSDSTES